LSKRFSVYLNNPPTPEEYFRKLIKEKRVNFSGFLLIDGKWFGKTRCLIVYKDTKEGIILWRFSKGEYLEEIKSDLKFLIENGYPIKGVTSDGSPGLISAVDSLNIPRQRCLVHLQLSIERLTTKNPKTKAGKDLLLWSKSLNQIEDDYHVGIMTSWFGRIYLRNKNFLKEKSHGINEKTGRKTWWYTHRYLRKAFRSVISARHDLFTYLEISDMPKDTNGLEGYFSQLKTMVNRHRGLKRSKKENLIAWMFWLEKFNQKPR
jgi:hypothetical protein